MKPGLWERIANTFPWSRTARSNESDGMEGSDGGFKAARLSNLTADWNPVGNTTLDYELRRDLAMMRRRSRDLCRNNDYARKFLVMCSTNVVGPQGIRLQVRATTPRGKPNPMLSSRVETAWMDWGKRQNASVTGKQSWIDMQRMFVQLLARDGEVLIHRRQTDSKHGFGLKFLTADFLDETYNRQLPNGNKILMSVEVDPDDRPVAYWLREPHFDVWFTQSSPYYRRVPAQEIIHAFIQEDPKQTRGVPWLYSAMFRLKMLGAYEEAEVVAARVGASKMGFYKKPAADLPDEEVRKKQAAPIESVSAGQLCEMPDGWEFEAFDPTHPNTNYGAFVKSCLRGVAAGLGVSYNGLAEDLEGVNYSSLRAGLLSERDNWKVMQNWVAENFNDVVYHDWLEAALLSGQVKVSAAEFAQITTPVWCPRGFAFVDPLKDLGAFQMAFALGVASKSDFVGSLGGDYEEMLQQRQADRELEEFYGETAASMPAENSPKGGAQDESDTEDSDDPDNGSDGNEGDTGDTGNDSNEPLAEE